MKGSRLPNVWVMSSEFHPHIIGGLGTAATDLCRSLAKNKANITVWCDSGSDRASIDRHRGQIIYRLPRVKAYYDTGKRSFKPNALQRLAIRRVKKLPDVIHIHSVEFVEAALFLKRKYRIPIIYSCHSLIGPSKNRLNRNRRNLQLLLLRSSDRIVAPSRWLRDEIRKLHASSKVKTVVIPHGVRHRTGLTKKPVHQLLYVGRLVKSKGVLSLVKAAALLAPKHRNMRLTLIGSGTKDFVRNISAFILRKKLTSRIRLLGYIPHNKVQRLYGAYGAVVVPSIEGESFCLTALEAMANGIPLLATRSGGLKELVDHRTAKIIPKVTDRHLADAIHDVLVHPAAARRRALRAHFKARRYSWSQAATRYAALFRLLSKR